MQGWRLPSLGSQGSLCKLGSTPLTLSPGNPPTTTTIATIVRKETQHNRGAVGLWFEEGNLGLYLVSRTTCKVGLSCSGIFSLLCGSLIGFAK